MVPEVAGDSWYFTPDFVEHRCMTLCGQQHGQTGRGHDGVKKLTSRQTGPRRAQHPWVCDDPQELVAHAPGEIPRPPAVAPALEEVAASSMLGSRTIGGVDQHIGIDDEQSAAFHGAEHRLTTAHVDERAAAVERRQRGQIHGIWPRVQELAERHLHEFGHGSAAVRGFATKPRHHAIGDIKGCLHMDNHTRCMLMRQRP